MFMHQTTWFTDIDLRNTMYGVFSLVTVAEAMTARRLKISGIALYPLFFFMLFYS
jgi:hypothetical protein